MFGPVLDTLAKHRGVIGVHLYGHGRAALGTRKISPVDMGRDPGVGEFMRPPYDWSALDFLNAKP